MFKCDGKRRTTQMKKKSFIDDDDNETARVYMKKPTIH